MAKLEFKSEDLDNREARQISFVVPDDMNINEFKIVCMRMASAMGYADNSIKKCFGKEEYDTELDEDLKNILSPTVTVINGSIISLL